MTWLISIEDLILAKLSWIQELQSSQQMNDIRSLVDNVEIDWTYIHHWVQELALNTFQLLPQP